MEWSLTLNRFDNVEFGTVRVKTTWSLTTTTWYIERCAGNDNAELDSSFRMTLYEFRLCRVIFAYKAKSRYKIKYIFI